jgi:hypothetical protein
MLSSEYASFTLTLKNYCRRYISNVAFYYMKYPGKEWRCCRTGSEPVSWTRSLLVRLFRALLLRDCDREADGLCVNSIQNFLLRSFLDHQTCFGANVQSFSDDGNSVDLWNFAPNWHGCLVKAVVVSSLLIRRPVLSHIWQRLSISYRYLPNEGSIFCTHPKIS